MPARTEKRRDHPKGREKTLRLSRRLEASHTPLSFSRWLVRVLCSVVEPCMQFMLHRRQDLGLGCGVAAQLVGDNHPGRTEAPSAVCGSTSSQPACYAAT